MKSIKIKSYCKPASALSRPRDPASGALYPPVLGAGVLMVRAGLLSDNDELGPDEDDDVLGPDDALNADVPLFAIACPFSRLLPNGFTGELTGLLLCVSFKEGKVRIEGGAMKEEEEKEKERYLETCSRTRFSSSARRAWSSDILRSSSTSSSS